MTFMNQCDGEAKLQLLVDALAACDGRRSYNLSLATCYCSPTAVVRFIYAISGKLKIAEIYLYLDRRTAIAIGQAELTALEAAYPEVLSIFSINAGRLFHTKGYCLAAYGDDDVIVDGRLAIGSANMTNSGLISEHGNIESITVHSDVHMIRGFLEFFDDEHNLIPLENLTVFSRDDANDFQDFKYAMLKLGLFSHKWLGRLGSYFSVRYHLNEEGRQRAQEPIQTTGFQMDAASHMALK